MAGFYPSDVTKAREIEKDNGKLRSRKQSEGGRQEVVKCARAGYASRLRPCPSYQHRRCFQCPWMARLPFRRPCLCPWVFAEGCCQHFAWPIGDHMPVKGDMISAVIENSQALTCNLRCRVSLVPAGPRNDRMGQWSLRQTFSFRIRLTFRHSGESFLPQFRQRYSGFLLLNFGFLAFLSSSNPPPSWNDSLVWN